MKLRVQLFFILIYDQYRQGEVPKLMKIYHIFSINIFISFGLFPQVESLMLDLHNTVTCS